MFRKLLLPVLITILALVFIAALPEPQPDQVMAGAPRQLVATFTPTPMLSPLPTLTAVSPPRIIAHQPGEPTLRVRRPTISLVFDRAMNQASVAAALRLAPTVPLDLRWAENTLHIVPRQPLTMGMNYQLTVGGTAVDSTGIALEANPAHFDYALAANPLASISGPTLERLNQSIELAFNFALDPQVAEQALTFEPTLAGTWVWNAQHTVAIFTPATDWRSDTDYTLHFKAAIVDSNGDPLPVPAPQHFTTPPPITVYTTPNQGNNYVNPLAEVAIIFDRPMDDAAVVTAFHISPPITGTLTWQETTGQETTGQKTTLHFRSTRGYLDQNTDYTVTLDAGLRSAEGEIVLHKPYTLNFRTGEVDKQASFGWGPNAQVLDAAGRRAIQFALSGGDTIQAAPALDFSLYRLTLEQFLAQYAAGFRGVAGNEKQTLAPESADLIKSWALPLEKPTDGTVNSNGREVLLPGDVPPGLYILTMGPPVFGDQLLVLLTHHVITLKQAEGQIVAWVTEINGNPVADVEVSLYTRAGLLLSQGRSDQQGVWRTQVAADAQPLLAVARAGDDLTATGLSNEWSSRNGQWWGWWQAPTKASAYAAYLYTDRPIYRPGQTVFFKGILRNDDDAALSLPPGGTPVTLRIRDGRDNIVQTFQLTTNAFGTVNGEFQLAEGAMLGEYAVEFSVDGTSQRQVFKVQAYHKPDYAVDVTTNAAQYTVGELVTITVAAHYFFGEPAPNASITVQQYQLQPLNSWDAQANGVKTQYAWYATYEAPIAATTAANGYFTFTLPAKTNNTQQPVDWNWQSSLQQSTWGVEVTVDDGSHQTVSNFATLKVFNAAEGLTLDTNGYAKTPGEPFTITVAAKTVASEPVAARTLQLRLERYSWNGMEQTTLIETIEMVTTANGQAPQRLTLTEPGYYQLVVSGNDRLGNAIKVESWLYAFSDASSWYPRGQGDLLIKADRDTYAPGENARLLVESTFSGPALVTFERGTTRREQLIQLTAPLTVLDTPVQPDDAPNIFVTINAWQPQDTTPDDNTWRNLPDSRLQTASVALHVPVTGKTLQISITPDRTQYAPRDAVTVTVHVADEQGTPVAAELSLALVDEAIFSLSDELSGPIFDAFYHERPNLVRTYDGMALTRYLGGMGGGGGGNSPGNPRSNFPDTAVWLPVVHTNASGMATVTLTLPDNLTSWRLTAKAVTAEQTQVGETKLNLVTQQPIIVRPSLPSSLIAGDQTQLSALVHNYSNYTQSLAVALQTDPTQLEIHGSITQTVRVAPGENRVVGWSATAVRAGEVAVTIRARAVASPSALGEPGGDAVRLNLSIHPLAIPDVATQVGQFTGTFSTAVQLPAAALDLSSVKLELSRSVAGTLLNGLEYLTGYPYGCVEQTMSRALPNAVVGRAFRQLGVGNPTLQAELPPLINAGLQRLYGYQHDDGGWGWWYDDSTDAYQTAWVIFGLSATHEAGYEVDAGVLQRGAQWLAAPQTLADMDIRTRAFALFSLANAGYGDLPATRALWLEAERLDTFSLAALALALHSLGVNDKAEQLLEQLAKTAVQQDGKAYWPSNAEDGHYEQKTMASTTRSAALALAAFVHIQPHHPLEPALVRWLMSQRRQQGWGSTNETSFTIWALTAHLLAQQETTATTTYRVELNGQELAHGRFGRDEPAVTLEIAAQQMRRGANTLRIEQSGGGQLYYVINNRTYRAEPAIAAAGAIQLERQYLDITTRRPLTHTVVGQLVQVQLQVQMADNGFYMLVEDALPGGLQALNESLNTSSHQAVADSEPQYYWQAYGYNEKQVHADRVTFFINELGAGQRTFTYVARATHAGEFVAMPVQAYAMYDATQWGRSASQTLVVEP